MSQAAGNRLDMAKQLRNRLLSLQERVSQLGSEASKNRLEEDVSAHREQQQADEDVKALAARLDAAKQMAVIQEVELREAHRQVREAEARSQQLEGLLRQRKLPEDEAPTGALLPSAAEEAGGTALRLARSCSPSTVSRHVLEGRVQESEAEYFPPRLARSCSPEGVRGLSSVPQGLQPTHPTYCSPFVERDESYPSGVFDGDQEPGASLSKSRSLDDKLDDNFVESPEYRRGEKARLPSPTHTHPIIGLDGSSCSGGPISARSNSSKPEPWHVRETATAYTDGKQSDNSRLRDLLSSFASQPVITPPMCQDMGSASVPTPAPAAEMSPGGADAAAGLRALLAGPGGTAVAPPDSNTDVVQEDVLAARAEVVAALLQYQAEVVNSSEAGEASPSQPSALINESHAAARNMVLEARVRTLEERVAAERSKQVDLQRQEQQMRQVPVQQGRGHRLRRASSPPVLPCSGQMAAPVAVVAAGAAVRSRSRPREIIPAPQSVFQPLHFTQPIIPAYGSWGAPLAAAGIAPRASPREHGESWVGGNLGSSVPRFGATNLLGASYVGAPRASPRGGVPAPWAMAPPPVALSPVGIPRSNSIALTSVTR